VKAWRVGLAVFVSLIILVIAAREFQHDEGSTPASVDGTVGINLGLRELPFVPLTIAEPGMAVASPPAGPSKGLTYWDLCGVGRVPVPAGTSPTASVADSWHGLPAPMGDTALEDVRRRMLALLPNAGPRDQLLALIWRGAGAGEIANLARSSGDGLVMRWAVARCQAAPASECNGLSSRDWAKLEPDNAAAWLTLWADEPTADAEVMAALRAGVRHQTHEQSLTAAMLAAVPPDVPGYVRGLLAVEVMGIQAAMGDRTGADLLFRRCRAPLLPDSPQRSQCDLVAQLLVERGDSFRARSLGLSLATKLAWPVERLRALRVSHEAIAAAAAAAVAGPQPLSCGTLEPLLATLSQAPQLGEFAAWQQHLAASALTPPRLATQKASP
jgi:hypothetical protein